MSQESHPTSGSSGHFTAFVDDGRYQTQDELKVLSEAFGPRFGTRHDIDRHYEALPEPTKDYVIFMTPRSGSTWLSEILKSHGGFGEPEEWFNLEDMDHNIEYTRSASLDRYIRHIRKMKRDSQTGLFGTEVSFFHLDLVERLASFFDVFDPRRTRFFYLTRRDIVAQAVSLCKAVRTQTWHEAGSAEPPYDEGELLYWLEHLLQQEDGFERTFTELKLQPVRLVYEDMIEAGVDEVCDLFCSHLGVEFRGTPKEKTTRLATVQSDEHVARLTASMDFQWLRDREVRSDLRSPGGGLKSRKRRNLDTISQDHRTKLEYVPKVIADWLAPVGGIAGKKVLDFGCGEGAIALGVALNCAPSLLVGCDLGKKFERSIALGQQIGLEAPPDNLRFEVITPGEISSEEEFDVIYSWSVFEHISQSLFDDVVGGLRAKLRPGGHLFVQIAPLYYSPEGSHLWAVGFDAWQHLLWQTNKVHAELYSRFGRDEADALWSLFATLNKITGPELVDRVVKQGFEVVRRYETTVERQPPEELLAAYSKEALLTEQIVVLFRKA